jgi:hypothetical protein
VAEWRCVVTIVEETLATLSNALPRLVCPFQVGIGDTARIDSEHLPVVFTDGHLDGVCRVLEYVSEIRKSNGEPVFEGSRVFEPGSPILLLRRAPRGVAA